MAPAGSTVYVSGRVSVRTEGTQRVISVHGVVFAHYELADRVAEAYAMIMLCESGYATQLQVARSFGYSARSLRRYQERFEAGGVSSLARAGGRPAGTRIPNRKERGRDQSILHLKTQGWSNRGIAGRQGVSEKAIRKRLRRLGWQPTAQPSLLLEPQVTDEASAAAQVTENVTGMCDPCAVGPIAPPPLRNEGEGTEFAPTSLDRDPLDRSTDRALAALGLLA
ncbi:MAG: hypothetical protein JWO52_6908 [Gammaproteobacteria bacterium]|nr:hypothetical protein [Gammaproteobacteria bacterium]